MCDQAGQDALELAAIRTALEGLGVPRPTMEPGPGYTAAWVSIALARTPPTPPTVAAVAAVSVEVVKPHPAGLTPEQRIAARQGRTGCPRPDKQAYDPSNIGERKILDRRRRDGVVLYQCSCSWWHLGHTLAAEAQPSPAGEGEPAVIPINQPLAWARDARRVVAINGAGQVYAAGRVICYHDAPTVLFETDEGRRVSWRADMAMLEQSTLDQAG